MDFIMDELVVIGKRKQLSDYIFVLLIGTIVSVPAALSLLGVISIIYVVPSLSLTLFSYGYVYSRLSLKEECLIINPVYLTYYLGGARKLQISIADINSLDFTDNRGSEIFPPLFIVHLNNDKSISAPYQLFEQYQLEAFGRQVKSFIPEIKIQ